MQLYDLRNAAGYEDILSCAEGCVYTVEDGGYLGCNDYDCLCKNHNPEFQKREACISNSCMGDKSDLATASSISSVWCTPGTTVPSIAVDRAHSFRGQVRPMWWQVY
jgi:CFEM domain